MTDKKIKVSMVSLGCCKNQVDGEIMLASLSKCGYEVIADAGLADVVIINTCGFISTAKEEAIENILEFCTLKEEGRIKKVIITGCLSERYREEVATEIPEADAVVGIGKNKDICDVVERVLAGEKVVAFGEKTDLSLSGDRVLTNVPSFAYVKIAEGCSNNCTYCAIPSIRGPFRSRNMEDIYEEVKRFSDDGIPEIILVAQDTTRYGEDIYGEVCLSQLLKKLCEIESLRFIRILYAYPERITDELIETIASEDKIVKYLDIPLQHASDDVLRRMNRRGNKESYLKLIKKLRERVPGIALRTSLIAGFPGETEKDFEELCEFVKTARFDRLGCFAYSAEEGTPADKFACQLDEETKENRADIVMTEQQTVMEIEAEKMVEKELEVIAEGFDKYAEVYIGRSYKDAPDIDPKVFFSSEIKDIEIGGVYRVKITDVMGFDLIGERID